MSLIQLSEKISEKYGYVAAVKYKGELERLIDEDIVLPAFSKISTHLTSFRADLDLDKIKQYRAIMAKVCETIIESIDEDIEEIEGIIDDAQA